ncbi:MAG: hypothetical protein JEY99_19075 [Spirochaetales bacterium]|nr:hypothetical protein [Spirochaetales bacterium]
MNTFNRLFSVLTLLIIFIILTGCPITEPPDTLLLTANWTSYENDAESIVLRWNSSGGEAPHNYLLQRMTTESNWLPEKGVLYSVEEADIPGLVYSGVEQTFTDSSVTAGVVYYYRLFAFDSTLTYSVPLNITISFNSTGVSTIETPVLRYIHQNRYYFDISWDGYDPNTAGFIIVRDESPIMWNPENGTDYPAGESVFGASIVWTGTGSTFSDTDLLDGHEYYYKIFAFNMDKLYSAGLQCQLVFESETDPESEERAWVDNYIIYYGPLDTEAINTAKQYDLAIIHPNNSEISREQVSQIQLGQNVNDPSDDVLVVAYLAVGEDLRATQFFPAGATEPDYAAMLEDERFVRNGIGPRVDPRGPKPNGDELEYNYSIGNASPGGTGFASYYLDDNDVVNGISDDGKPDFNPSWRGAFVNAGDPLWFQEVDEMRRDDDGVFGLQELLTTTVGKGLGVDGVFMDALDTCAPNGWTDENSFVQNEFEWTAPGYADFIKRLKEKYPDKIVIQNRAVFLLRPGFKQHYLKYTTRPYIDFLLFESFRLNSNITEDYNEQYYFDNRYNYAPPILAEASRTDGFQILSLGYAAGSTESLRSALDTGSFNESLIEDIRVTQNIGFRHYLSTPEVDHLNNYVLDYGDWTDTEPPAWSSVYNENAFQVPPGVPVPRYGLLDAESPEDGVIRVFWDLAQDKYAVDYYLYYKTSPFDFINNPELNGIGRIKLTPQMPEDYRTLSGTMNSTIYPFYDDVEGFSSGTTYHLCIRAVDRSPNRNMDENESGLYLAVN